MRVRRPSACRRDHQRVSGVEAAAASIASPDRNSRGTVLDQSPPGVASNRLEGGSAWKRNVREPSRSERPSARGGIAIVSVQSPGACASAAAEPVHVVFGPSQLWAWRLASSVGDFAWIVNQRQRRSTLVPSSRIALRGRSRSDGSSVGPSGMTTMPPNATSTRTTWAARLGLACDATGSGETGVRVLVDGEQAAMLVSAMSSAPARSVRRSRLRR